MKRCFFLAWFGIAAVLTLVFSVVLWTLAIGNIDPGNDFREAHIDRYCAAIRSWGQESNAWNGFSFALRNEAGHEEECTFSSAPTNMEDTASHMSDGECGAYDIRKVVCGSLDSLVPNPVVDASYALKLDSKSASSTDLAAQIAVRLGAKAEAEIPATSDGNCDGSCKKNRARSTCHGEKGDFNEESWSCRVLLVMTSAKATDEPCFVLAPHQGRLRLADDVWTAVDALDRARCTIPAVSKFEATAMIQVDAVSDVALVSPEALQQRAQNSVIVFRLSSDPFVIASVLSDSSFDFGLSKSEKLIIGILLLIPALCFTACFGGALFGLWKCGINGGDKDQTADDFSVLPSAYGKQ